VTNRNGNHSHFFPIKNNDLIEKGENNAKGQFTSRTFILLSPQTISSMIGANQSPNQHFDPIPEDKYSSIKEYRAAVYGAYLQRRPGTYPRSFLAGRVGVCNKTAINYDELEGIQVIPQFERKKLTIGKIKSLPEKKEDIPGNIWLEAGNKKFAYTQEGAQRAFQHHKKVEIVSRLKNYYSV
jgi:hypothetical protein